MEEREVSAAVQCQVSAVGREKQDEEKEVRCMKLLCIPPGLLKDHASNAQSSPTRLCGGGREGGGGKESRGRRRLAGWGVLLARGAIHLARFW